MTSLSKYILKQHLGPFAFACGLIVFILILDVVLQMMDQVLGKGLAFGVAGRLFVYNLAWIIALAVPMAVLVAVLMAFGRLSADNEIMAVKSSGIGLMRLVYPVIWAAALLTLAMAFFNDRVLPDWNHRARNIAADLRRRKAAVVLKQKEGVFIRELGTYSLLIRRIDEESNKLSGITVYDSGQPGAPTTLHARSGELRIFEEGRYIELTLNDGEYHRVDSDHHENFVRGTFARQVIHIEDRDRAFNQYRSSYRSDREMDISAMLDAIDNSRAEVRGTMAVMDSSVREFVAAAVGPNGDGSAPEDGKPADLRQRADDLKDRLKKHWLLNKSRQRKADAFLVEIHKKFSIAAACLVFVLVGAPLGVIVRSRGAAVSVAVSLSFFFAYWMFLIGGEELADRGYVAPALAMWAPNIVFGLLGVALLRITAFDKPLFPLRGRRPRERADGGEGEGSS